MRSSHRNHEDLRALGVRQAAYMLHHTDREHNACESSIIAMRHSQRTRPPAIAPCYLRYP